MFVFKKADLIFTDYSWDTCNESKCKVKSFPNRAQFNYHDGYEMISFINNFIHGMLDCPYKSDDEKIELGNEIEKILHCIIKCKGNEYDAIEKWVNKKLNSFF